MEIGQSLCKEKRGANRYGVTVWVRTEEEIVRGFLGIYLETVTFKVRDNSKCGIILSSFCFCKAQIDQLKPVSFLLKNTKVIRNYQMKRKREKSTTDNIFKQKRAIPKKKPQKERKGASRLMAKLINVWLLLKANQTAT